MVTREALRSRDVGSAFILAHRATLIVESFDAGAIRELLQDVERRRAAPSLEQALPLLQRCFRLEWERSLSRGIVP